MAVSEKQWMVLMYDYLVGPTWDYRELSKDSGIAWDWEANEDLTEWTFYIREGVKFHNGDDVTAEDVAFTIERQIRPEAAYGESDLLRQTINSTIVEGPYEIRVVLNNPDFLFPYYFSAQTSCSGLVIPKDYFEEVGEAGFNSAPVGTGPYRMAEHDTGNYIRFEAVEDHFYYGTPEVDVIQFDVVPEPSTRAALIQTGEADVAPVLRQTAFDLEAEGYHIGSQSDAYIMGFYIPQQWEEDNPLSDERVRWALIYGCDRQEIADTIMYGMVNTVGILHELSWAVGIEEPMPVPPYDPDLARDLLEEAGYGDGLTLNFYAYPRPDTAEWRDISEALVSYWADVGIETNLIITDYTTIRPNWVDGTFPITAIHGPQGTSNSPLFIARVYYLFHSSGTLTSCHDPDMDAALDLAKESATFEEYIERQDAVRQKLYDEARTMPLFEYGSVYACSDRIPSDWQPARATACLNLHDIFATQHPDNP
jgi:peptide/nickel transport system substrate-binding protein